MADLDYDFSEYDLPEDIDTKHGELAYDDIESLYRKVNFSYLRFMNFGHDEDYDKFSKELDSFIGVLISTLMNNQSYSGAGDALFAGILFRINREMSRTLAKPMNLQFKGLTLTLTINPILFRLYFKGGPTEMLAGIRQMCYHIIFNHLTAYDWAFDEEDDTKVMTIAMDAEVNQYIKNLPDHEVTLDWVKQTIQDKMLQEKEGTIYYYNKMKQTLDDPARPGHDRVKTTFEQMKGSGQLNDMYSQLATNFDPDKAKELRINSAEQLSDEMKKNHSMQPITSNGQNSDLHRKIINGLVRNAYEDMTEEMRENLSGELTEEIGKITKKRSLNWRDVIKRGIGSTAIPYKLSKNRVNRRQPYRLDLPGRTLDTISRLVAFIDTSSSQTPEALSYSLSELANIQKTLNTEVWVVQIDTTIQKAEKLSRQTLDHFNFKGRGGTSFAPAYEWLYENGFSDNDSVAVYFTDGYGDDGFERYGYHNMYWVLTDADPREPSPLSTDSEGKLLYLKADEKFNHQVVNNLVNRQS